MRTLQKVVLVSFFYVLLVGPNTLTASEIVHEFKNPAFSGNGYSSHVLSIEQLQYNREKNVKDDAKSAASAADSEVILVLLGHGILVIDCVYAVGLNALV